MALRTIDAVLNAACDAAVDLVDVGAGDGKIQFRTGARPANVTDAAAGTLLAEVTFPATAFGAAASGAAAGAGMPLATTGVADGDIGHFRVLDGGGNVLWDDDDVGTSGTALVVNTLTVSNGGDFEATSYTFTVS